MIAKGIQVLPTMRNGNRVGKGRGFIAALKDGYGFIENADHNKEIFFHFRYVFKLNFKSQVL